MHLLQHYAFFALISHRFRFIESKGLRTTAVDGKGNLYYNPDHIDAMSDQDMIFELGHEVGHIVFGHIQREAHITKNNPLLHGTWNRAADIVIDGVLQKKKGTRDNFVMPRSDVSKKNISDEVLAKYDGWTTEAVYADLLKEKEEKDKNPPDKGDEPSPGEGTEYEMHDGGRECCTKTFNTSGQEEEGIDWTQAIIQAAAEVRKASGKGSLPGAVEEFVRRLVKPEVKWTDLLRNMVNRSKYAESTWMKPSRRTAGIGLHLPRYVRKPTPDVVFMADTSGSISNEFIIKGFSEGYYLMKSFGMDKLWFLLHDVPCYMDELLTIDDLKHKKFKVARGGTCHIDVMGKAMEHKPKIIVSFTDLDTTFPPNPGVPVIWVVPKGDGKKPVPYGRIVEVERS